MGVAVKILDDIAWVEIDNPPVNAIGQLVRAGLLAAVETIDNSKAKIAILICRGGTFVAGADVREFGQDIPPPHLPDVIDVIENARVPWVAAMHGTALGGGLELALGCAYRVAVPTTKMGLPEVALGLIPGAGGTVRLPRLIAPVQALEMITSGKPVTANKALSIGLIDQIATGDLPEAALAFAKDVMANSRPTPLLGRTAAPANDAFNAALAKIVGRAKGQHSIHVAAKAVARALTLTGKEALAAERADFIALKEDPQSLALRHVFFAERSAAKLPMLADATLRIISKIGVVGGGTMGAGIAAAALMAGIPVIMIERDQSAANIGAARVQDILTRAESIGKISTINMTKALEMFVISTDYKALAHSDLVIEAVFEDRAIKAEVFATLDKVTRPGAILATNTSYLDVTALAVSTKHPERVIGLHFFSPAHIMKLLEVIVPPTALPDVVATGMALGKRLGKITVPSGVCDGFIGNRIMSTYRREADYLIEDGAFPHQVDAAMRDFGFPIGVFQMQDLAGLDIAWAMRKRRAATRPKDERYVTIADTLCKAGRFGRKSGRGWYAYETDAKGAVDPEVTDMILEASKAANRKRRDFTDEEIMQRILSVMQREGQALLAEGIAASAAAIDVVMINGYGFPRWRGGPMYMAQAHKDKK